MMLLTGESVCMYVCMVLYRLVLLFSLLTDAACVRRSRKTCFQCPLIYQIVSRRLSLVNGLLFHLACRFYTLTYRAHSKYSEQIVEEERRGRAKVISKQRLLFLRYLSAEIKLTDCVYFSR